MPEVLSAEETETLRDENKKLKIEVKKLLRELKYEQMVNERSRNSAEAKEGLSRIIASEKTRLDRYMNSLLSNCPDLILFFNTEGRLAFVSDSYLNISKTAAAGIIKGKTYRELLSPVVSEEFLARTAGLSGIALTERRIVEAEQDIDFGQGGDMRHYIMQVLPIVEGDGQSEGFVLFFYDTTETTRARVEAERARELAERSTQAKSEFLSRMSHEMRTPMNAIIGMTTIARASSDPQRKEYCLDKINEASVHLLGVINDILDMSKIEANKFELSDSEFNFEKMLNRVTNVINFRVEEKRQNIFVELDRDIPENIVSDEQRLAQVITNLLSNSVKFTPEGGSIWLSAKKISLEGDACTIRVTVRDSGIGISEEQKSRLFTSFEQADGSISRKFGGTGLGLAISKRIVELMEGRIWIESELGHGSSFIFEIKARIADARSRRLLPSDVNWGNMRVLVVDDAPEILEIFKAILVPYGVTCETTLSGEGAMRLIEERGGDPYDVFFIDWKMPGMDGIELTRKIKEICGAKPVVIMISASDWTEMEPQARSAGVDRFLQKPLFPSALFNAINECMSRTAQAKKDDAVEVASCDGIFCGKRVLLAEDVAINCEILSSLIEHTGVALDYASDGKEALGKFSADPNAYDLILMDVHMPNMDGYEATKNIRASEFGRAKTIPIIAMTANVFREDVERCRQVGMNDHLGKPIDAAEVITKMRKYMQ
ncbi:MAG: response regulator [Synergistaceae bacterium]|nr:response regulator [Synergistaceae bacterium]